MQQSSFTVRRTGGDDDATTAGQGADTVPGQAQESAQQVASQARERIREQLGERTTQAGEQVASTARDIRTVAQELRKQGNEQPARLAEQAADRAERVGGYLKDADADRLLHDLEELGRGRPWAIALGGILAGFASSRFLKASSGKRYRIAQYRGVETGPGRPRGVETVPQLPNPASAERR